MLGGQGPCLRAGGRGGDRLGLRLSKARIIQGAFALSCSTTRKAGLRGPRVVGLRAAGSGGSQGLGLGRTPNPLLHRALDATKAASSGSRGGSSFTDASEEETGKGEKSKTFLGRLKVLTFNLLAPCYFRSDGVYESASMRKTLRRHRCIIEVLRDQR